MSGSTQNKSESRYDREESEPSSIEEFYNKNINEYRDINIFLKSKKYSRLGIYLSGFLLYLVLAFYFSEDILISDPTFIVSVIIAFISSILTVLLYLNKWRYDFTQEDITYHEVAALVNLCNSDPDAQELTYRIERFSEIVLEDNPILPKVWREKLEHCFSYYDEKNVEEFCEKFQMVGLMLINTIERFQSINSEEMLDFEEENSTSQNSDPSFFEVVSDSLDSEYISKNIILWFIFIIAAVAGLGLAFLKGQGWGVLLVTIVFGGLRLYDRQTD